MTALASRQVVRSTGLDALFAPRGVVVVGASGDPTKLGGAMAVALSAGERPVGLVNARGAAGTRTTVAEAAADVIDAGGVPDLAVLCVPAAACADAAAACAEAGVSALLVCSGGFGESGPEGAEHERRLLEVVRSTGLRLLGPNTSGYFVPGARLRASFVPDAAQVLPGHVAVVAASGGLNHALSFALQRSGEGVALGVGIGAGVDVTAADVLDHLAATAESGHGPVRTEASPGARSVALHLETVPDGPALLYAVHRVSRHLPVVALVVGENDIGGFAASHTGALATSWRTTRALLRQAGAVVVDREDDLLTAASALARGRLRPGDAGVGLVTAQAGPGLLVADALHRAGVSLPELSPTTRERLGELLPPMTYQANPVDTGRPGPQHRDVVAAVAADPAISAVGVYALAEPVVDLPRAIAEADLGGTVAVVGLDGTSGEVDRARAAGHAAGLPVAVGPGALATALTALVHDARAQAALHRDETPTAMLAAAEPAVVPVVEAGPWDEARAKDLLGQLGIATPPRRVCHSRSEAHAALADLAPLGDGGRVVVKVSDAAILHKSDVGGVHVGVRDGAGLDVALDALARLGDQPCLVEAMAAPGVDLVVGARRDPVFGPVVVLGAGGIATEVLADVAIAAADPALLTRAQLLALPDQLRTRALLDGHRGAPAVDREQLADVLAALAALLASNPALEEVEVNPLRATADGLLALDAVIVTTEAHRTTQTREDRA
ncbi:acetyltransferase [Quadrisphaera granulorum]|uniref:Acetyltransferase n=1 Tax=Quadrisphaera granulorum TaxID=317664 RepID=A0A316A8X5_9ACTN|nr:acetate--CoA ligase family protein [Quadrisphaera granulorum]PWJ54151.1 acetyltransferase [Quadrisphaera granulorum]SZE96290.1 acetyltransferase [Quadrisphaera granulorum]